jgi:hypothetical protein
VIKLLAGVLAGVLAFAAVGAGLLYAAGKAGYAGLALVAAVEVLAILAIANASTRA